MITLTIYAAAYQNPSRHIELDIDIGADARDWSAIQASEKLKPVEIELRRIEETVNEIVQEMEYLRLREQKLRDTNESTNERVKWFALGTMGMLVGLGAWQVVYLRAYFRYVCEGVLMVWVDTDYMTDQSTLSKCFHSIDAWVLILNFVLRKAIYDDTAVPGAAFDLSF